MNVSIRFHRARQGRTLAVVTTSRPGLVVSRRILLPVGPAAVASCGLVVAQLLRHLPPNGPTS